MLSRPLGTASLLAALALAVPAPAWACGFWYLQDDEHHVEVEFLVTSMRTARSKAPPTARKKAVGWFNHEPPPICQRPGAAALAVRNGQFLNGTTVLGRLEGTTLRMGARAYEIALQPIVDRKGRQDLVSDIPYWDVDVRIGGKSVARGPAMSFATCSKADQTHKEEEIRQRVACYLVLTRAERRPVIATPAREGQGK